MEEEGAFGAFDELGLFGFEKARCARVFGFAGLMSIFHRKLGYLKLTYTSLSIDAILSERCFCRRGR